jgi:hypothetical protein
MVKFHPKAMFYVQSIKVTIDVVRLRDLKISIFLIFLENSG